MYKCLNLCIELYTRTFEIRRIRKFQNIISFEGKHQKDSIIFFSVAKNLNVFSSFKSLCSKNAHFKLFFQQMLYIHNFFHKKYMYNNNNI